MNEDVYTVYHCHAKEVFRGAAADAAAFIIDYVDKHADDPKFSLSDITVEHEDGTVVQSIRDHLYGFIISDTHGSAFLCGEEGDSPVGVGTGLFRRYEPITRAIPEYVIRSWCEALDDDELEQREQEATAKLIAVIINRGFLKVSEDVYSMNGKRYRLHVDSDVYGGPATAFNLFGYVM